MVENAQVECIRSVNKKEYTKAHDVSALLPVAFIFNWIGFFLSFCSTNTIAGRYGAISGFGLSLIKWILIVRFSDYFIGYFEGKIWLWWIFLAVGFWLFTRGFVNYAKVRKVAAKITNLKKSRFLFIY
ncbi:NEDD4 family-interacting protein 1-like [Heterodontus francisci]|uniref:NEDD4 family-interacting protein 1-like n=1 Tax=Heterodontus francisci TaxID=7792 RepID=UPI00355AF1BD